MAYPVSLQIVYSHSPEKYWLRTPISYGASLAFTGNWYKPKNVALGK